MLQTDPTDTIAGAMAGSWEPSIEQVFQLHGQSQGTLDPYGGNWWIGQQPGTTRQFLAAPQSAQGGGGMQRSDLAAGNNSFGSRVVASASHQIGINYVWGGDDRSGFDCSGLVYWALNHAGYKVPRTTAQGYLDMSTRVSQKQLRPGDLVFFNFAGGHGAEHVGIYAGNGQYIDAPHTGAQVRKEAVPWSAVIGMGRIGKGGGRAKPVPGSAKPTPKKGGGGGGQVDDASLAGAMAMSSQPASLGDVMTDILAPKAPHQTQGAGGTGNFTGPHAATEQQLYKGFMAAGRPDLAKMVGTQAFTTWINAESGWRVNAQSPANNQGQANGGLFQFWYGHGWTSQYQGAHGFTANAYQQAIMVAKYFHLTAADITDYARQIHNGSYQGWG